MLARERLLRINPFVHKTKEQHEVVILKGKKELAHSKARLAAPSQANRLMIRNPRKNKMTCTMTLRPIKRAKSSSMRSSSSKRKFWTCAPNATSGQNVRRIREIPQPKKTKSVQPNVMYDDHQT